LRAYLAKEGFLAELCTWAVKHQSMGRLYNTLALVPNLEGTTPFERTVAEQICAALRGAVDDGGAEQKLTVEEIGRLAEAWVAAAAAAAV
jgi:hypothetical protein